MVRTLDWRDELRLWKAAVASRPNQAKTHFNNGNALRDAGQIDEAFQEWEKALQLDPNYPQIWVNIGAAEKRRGNIERAEECYKKALALKSDYGLAHYNLALLYANNLNNVDLALEHFLQAAQTLYRKESTNRLRGMAHCQIARILSERGDEKQAMIHLRRAENLSPRNAEVYMLIGVLSRDHPQSAREAFLTAIQLNPDYSEAFFNLGVLEWEQGNPQKAESLWQRALDLNPALQKQIDSIKTISR